MNGCFNRRPFVEQLLVQDGWDLVGKTRTPRMVKIVNPMEKSCQYSKNDKYKDKLCINCKQMNKPIE